MTIDVGELRQLAQRDGWLLLRESEAIELLDELDRLRAEVERLREELAAPGLVVRTDGQHVKADPNATASPPSMPTTVPA